MLQDRRILFVLPPKRFDEGQFYQSWQLLAEEGAWLTAASDAETGRAIGESGAAVRTLDLASISAAEFDGVLIVDSAEEEVAVALDRSARIAGEALAGSRTLAAFGRIGAELHAAGLPVVRAKKNGLARFIAELAVRISRQPRIAVSAGPAASR